MPVRIIGMIGVAPPGAGATVHIIAGGISSDYLVAYARAHETAGFDMALVGYNSSSADGFSVTLHAAHHTERLGYLLAHRPGLVAPTLAARKFATLDVLTKGRLAVHIIAGLSDAEQQSEGDFLSKPERYARAAEYIEVIKRVWTSSKPFDYEGKHYRLKAAISDIKPHQQPHPLVFFGGSSEEALEMGSAQCEVFALFGEPLAETAERIADFRRRALLRGRRVGFNISFRPIIAETEDKAWDKARAILADVQRAQPYGDTDKSGQRLLGIAAKGDVHDARLWMPIAAATGARGNTSCLVGTPAQVADAMIEYYRLGVDSFLIRGFDPFNDTLDYGRELIPRLRAGVAAFDARATQPAAAE